MHRHAPSFQSCMLQAPNNLWQCRLQERAKEEKAAYAAKLAGAGGDDDAGDDVADDADDAGGDSD